MKKSFIITVICICVAVIGLSVFTTSAKTTDKALAKPASKQMSETEVKLLNMLNHNFVYGEDFDDVSNIVNCSLNALTKYKVDGDYISKTCVIDFVNNMYGVNVCDFECADTEENTNKDYIFVSAGGYTSYTHKNISLIHNEDGTITANTDVCIMGHDGGNIVTTASTLFVPNEKSAFGYNIVYSEILSESTPI